MYAGMHHLPNLSCVYFQNILVIIVQNSFEPSGSKDTNCYRYP